MKLLVLGASGGCGMLLVRNAVNRGHEVIAIVGPLTPFVAPPGVTVVRDDVLRDGAIAEAAGVCNAVISCLGIRRRHPRNPWSRLVSPADFTSRTAKAIVHAARAARIERVLAISAAGVADSWPCVAAPLRWLFAHSRIGDAYRDLAAMEATYAASGLDWTCVRPVTLVDRTSHAYREVDRYALTATIARETVARWLLDQVVTTGACTRTPMLGGARHELELAAH